MKFEVLTVGAQIGTDTADGSYFETFSLNTTGFGNHYSLGRRSSGAESLKLGLPPHGRPTWPPPSSFSFLSANWGQFSYTTDTLPCPSPVCPRISFNKGLCPDLAPKVLGACA